MILKLLKEMTGAEFTKSLQEKYGSMNDLKRLIKKDPENPLYNLDLEDWIYHLEHPESKIKQEEIIFLKDIGIEMKDLELIDTIKNKHPKSIRNLSQIIEKDIKTVYPKVKRLEEGGFLKLENGPKNSKIPVVNYNKIEIEI